MRRDRMRRYRMRRDRMLTIPKRGIIQGSQRRQEIGEETF